MNLSVRAVLMSGLAALMVVIAASSLVTSYEVSKIEHELTDIVDSRVPLAVAMAGIAKETQASAAALNGWVITHNPAYRTARARAWENLDKLIADADRLIARLAPSGQTAVSWKAIRPEFDQLRQAQARLEAFTGTPEQAANLLVTDVAPHRLKIANAIDGTIGASGQQEAGLDDRQIEVLMAEGRDAMEQSRLLMTITWI